MQISVTISDEEYQLLTEIAKATGRSNSALAGEWIRQGLYNEVGNLNKVEVWRGMVAKKQQKSEATDE